MWHFRKKLPAEKIRNPIQGEFFAQEAIAGPAQALVRESIQNSLDASARQGPVRVEFSLVTGARALSPPSISRLFSDAWPHFAAAGNGLQNAPDPSTPCSYLLIEDYGTTGLTGDPAQSDPDAPNCMDKNPFYLFFRAEGLSGKTGTELGRWGVGKFVFPRSSRASTHFGVTVRHDDGRRLLLGAATLKSHRIVGDSAVYTPDGLYGRLRKDGFVEPIEDRESISEFNRLFGITRSTEPGLSVVVPFIDDEEITFEALLEASVRDYFLPVLDGRLELIIRSARHEVQLTAASLKGVLSGNAVLASSVLPLVELAEFAGSVAATDRIPTVLPDPKYAASWHDDLVPPATLKAIREHVVARTPFAVRVPVAVRPKGVAGYHKSHFDIFMQADRHSDGRPVFVREGIIISDVRGKRAREIRSLVVIEDRPLAGMLGDSENPAHTQWQRDGSNFKGRYTYGKALIDFVADSVGALLGIVNRSEQQADPSLTVDFFSIEPPAEPQPDDVIPSSVNRPGKPPGPEDNENPVHVEPRRSRVRIQRSAGGLSIGPGTEPPTAPYLVEVRCAYDTRNGNPLKKWDAADFTLGGSGLPVACEGAARISTTRDNLVMLVVEGPEFRVAVTGFDTNRDVFVRADIREASHAGTEA